MKAFTDYFGDVEEITLLSYDGDKYVKIIRSNGEEASIKRGYCFKNPSKYTEEDGEEYGSWKPKPQHFSKYVWWKLEGKKKENFVAREKDYYNKYSCEGFKFKTRKASVRFALQYVKTRRIDVVEVNKQDTGLVIFCYSDGEVLLYDRDKKTLHHNGLFRGKYMKGFGKIKYRGKRHGRKEKKHV